MLTQTKETLQLGSLFQKDIRRPIETVIKADDRDHVLQEVEEYVITNEIAKKLGDFFESYNTYEGINGVWISGFFGSGKSHLLKILSYVLENTSHQGKHLGELFAAKVVDDPKLKADIQAGTRINSESILFNIDQQAQITSKADANAILEVFYKVFYDHLGFYGFRPHVAEFEHWLQKEGKFEDFKRGFETQFGKPWTQARIDYVNPLVTDTISEVCGQLFSTDSQKFEDILDKYDDRQKFSIENFAEKVADYIQTKGKDFRLNFFVDEIGQYIAENTKLMLNLQTIAESLATKCKGRSWIIVTSQEDLERVIGDEGATQTNDFSKIIGRFRIRIPLTSANVDEVIEKRLLEKKAEVQPLLQTTWKAEKENLTTILSFSDAGIQFKFYKGEEDFVSKYPFIPYQFDLFQQCIKALSRHNAFQGKHASVGERNMLGTFQEVLKDVAIDSTRSLISFDKLFEGIRSTIKGEIQNAVTLAERQLSNDLAVRILKALFLVKYYDNFKTTKRNIAVLLMDSMDADLKAHEKAVEEALNLLEQQTYLQRNGDIYEYLTDDEKDIEDEIKATDIDAGNITLFFGEVLFDEIIGDKLKCIENKLDYDFTRKVDGVSLGREKELTIEIVTPNSDNYDNDSYYAGQSLGNQTLMILKLPQDDLLIKDSRLFKKTEKYIKQNQSTTNKDSVKRILFEKAQQNIVRRKQLTAQLKTLLGSATVYLNGTVHTVASSTDGKTKVANAFQDLIKLAYPKLKLLENVSFDEPMLKNLMRSKQDDLFGSDDTTMSAAEAEVLQLIQRRKKQDERTTLSDIRDAFAKKPYGWSQMAVWCVTGRLFKRGKIEARQDSEVLEDQQFLEALMNNRLWATTLVLPQVEFDSAQVKKLKDFYQSLFNESNPYSEPKEAATQFKQKAQEEHTYIKGLLTNQAQYHFLKALKPLDELLGKLIAMDYATLITAVKDVEDAVLDAKEDVLDPIKRFMNGEQKKIYDTAHTFLTGNQANFDYIDSHEKSILADTLASVAPYKGDTMRRTKEAIDTLKEKVLHKIEEEKGETLTIISQKVEALSNNDDYKKLPAHQQDEMVQPFHVLTKNVKDQTFIANIRDYRQQASELYTVQLNKIAALLTPPTPGASEAVAQYIKSSNLRVEFDKHELRTEEDVEEYVAAIKKAYLEQIKRNRKITLH
ncbi:MAG TPA: BREX system P-loop protein BrxC [Flavisolibacter sp.]|jgi:hypothetical protein|nr:BREX system P-loop protein BrxC [Flavisolibacter sp.]